METAVIAIHVIAAVAVVALVLLQQGKGAEMGASFGSGSANTLFGPQGAGTVFSRATAILIGVFFVTSFALAILAKDKLTGSLDEGVPSAEVIDAQAADTEIPAAETTAPAAEDDVPKQP